MATAKGHLIGGLRGKLGNLVFRYRRGRTYVSKAPVFTQPPSELQVTRRNLFAEAVAFAKAELRIPERRAYYQQLARRRKGHTTAFNMAIKEFMRNHHKQQLQPPAQAAAVPHEPVVRQPIRAAQANILHVPEAASYTNCSQRLIHRPAQCGTPAILPVQAPLACFADTS